MRLVLAALLVLVPAGFVAAADEATPADAGPVPPLIMPPLHRDADSDAPPVNSYFVQPFPGLIESYGTSYTALRDGPHQVAVGLGSVNYPTGAPWSGDLYSANLGSSVTYRYMGLFGGIVRPVARFSVGAAQTWSPVGGRSTLGYADTWTPYALPEAGLEIVYKGVGVGMTVSYPLFVEPYDPDKKFGGGYLPGRFRQRGLDWSQLLKNIYLIVE